MIDTLLPPRLLLIASVTRGLLRIADQLGSLRNLGVGRVERSQDVPHAMRHADPYIVVFDAAVDAPACFAAGSDVREASPSTRLVFSFPSLNDAWIRSALALEASGVLLSAAPPAALLADVHHILDGHVVMPDAVLRRLVIDERGVSLGPE